MEKPQPLRGFKDVLFANAERFSGVIKAAKQIAYSYDYQDAYFPILESYEVFHRSLGDASDIVSKEMYVFNDRSDKQVALRPEFTAQIVRAYISESLQQNLPLRFFTYGPLFRYERPQKGRLRQFHQVNFESFGIASEIADAELIIMAARLLGNLQILKDTKLKLNSLGCKESRISYRTALVEFFTRYENDLSEDSKRRLKQNPLRILDSKDANDRKLIENVPTLRAYLSASSQKFFANLQQLLTDNQVAYEWDEHLVRGLDYYNDTVFEFVTDKLGAQGTVLAGGRYDGLVATMGGNDTPALGFAAGIERLLELANFQAQESQNVAILPVSENEYNACLSIAEKMRNKADTNISIMLAPKSIGKRIEKASKTGKTHIAIIGEDEVRNASFALRDLISGKEDVISINGLEVTASNA